MSDFTTHDVDVLVIGAGGPGLLAAIAAAAHGPRTTLVGKSLPGNAHWSIAEGGIAPTRASSRSASGCHERQGVPDVRLARHAPGRVCDQAQGRAELQFQLPPVAR